jgi:hypothetical protein
MPDSLPARSPFDRALDQGLGALFRGLQARPVPEDLLRLVDRLEAQDDARVDGESRAVA